MLKDFGNSFSLINSRKVSFFERILLKSRVKKRSLAVCTTVVQLGILRLNITNSKKCHQTPPFWLISGLTIFENFSCHRHFHFCDVMIIMLYVSSTNSTISYHLKAFLYMLYFVSYCSVNLPWGK